MRYAPGVCFRLAIHAGRDKLELTWRLNPMPIIAAADKDVIKVHSILIAHVLAHSSSYSFIVALFYYDHNRHPHIINCIYLQTTTCTVVVLVKRLSNLNNLNSVIGECQTCTYYTLFVQSIYYSSLTAVSCI